MADSPKPNPDSGDGDKDLIKSSAVFGGMTLSSRFLGLLRDIMIARFFGADAAADAFFLAFKIPNFLRRLFAEGAFSQAFVPVLSEYRQTRSLEDVKDLVDRVAGALGGILALVTAFAVMAAPLIAALFAPGFVGDPIKYALVSDMVRITFPYLLFISLAGFAGAILNTYGRFAVPAFTPIFLNLFMIAGAFASVYLEQPIMGLAWGVFMAGMMQVIFQLPSLQRLQLLPKPKWDLSHPGVKQIMTLMIPALFGVSVSQINLLLDTVLASFLPTGSVSWLYYSDRLWELPLGVFGVALATVILPSLSRKNANLSLAAFSATLDWAIRIVILIALPAAIALVILAEPILITLFQYEKMTAWDVTMSALSLRAYSMGLLAFMLIKVLAPGFYSRQDMKTPVSIGIKAMLTNMVLNLLLVIPLHYYWQVGHLGLACATTLSSYLNAFLLYRGLRRQSAYAPAAAWSRYIAQVIFAVVLMSIALLWAVPATTEWLSWGWIERVTTLIPLCMLGGAVYVIALLLGGIRPRQFSR